MEKLYFSKWGFFDLNEKYEWAEKNQEETAYIAWNGYLKAHNYIKRIPEHFMSVLLKNKYNNQSHPHIKIYTFTLLPRGWSELQRSS